MKQEQTKGSLRKFAVWVLATTLFWFVAFLVWDGVILDVIKMSAKYIVDRYGEMTYVIFGTIFVVWSVTFTVLIMTNDKNKEKQDENVN